MFSIRMANQVRRVRKLVKNVKSIVYPSSMLFAYYISPDKFKQKMKFCENDSLYLKDKSDFEPIIKKPTLDAVSSASQTLTVASELMTNLSTEYRTLLKKLISLSEEILINNIEDTSGTKFDLLIDLQNKMQIKKEQVKNIEIYIAHTYIMIAQADMMLSMLVNIEDERNVFQQQMRKTIDKINQEINDNFELEHKYWYIQQECFENIKNASTKFKLFTFLKFRINDMTHVNFFK